MCRSACGAVDGRRDHGSRTLGHVHPGSRSQDAFSQRRPIRLGAREAAPVTFLLLRGNMCMSLRKYQKAEDARVLEEQESQKIAAELHRMGKTSAAELSDTERKSALDTHRE
jgi:hypothetical protein